MQPVDAPVPFAAIEERCTKIITPHVSADDGDSYVPLTLDLFLRNLERFAAEENLINRVDRALGY